MDSGAGAVQRASDQAESAAPQDRGLGSGDGEAIPWWEVVIDWLTTPVVYWTMFLIGVSTVVLAVMFLPLVVARLPADRFAVGHALLAERRTAAGWVWLGVRNLLGGLLVIVGVILLLLPGQGLLMIFVGLLMMDFPGKHALERRIVRRPAILRALNGMRQKRGQPPFVFEQPDSVSAP